MRLRSLRLERYGRFSGLELDFPDSGVCLIYGDNEAGKTTTLSALSDLLYGFPDRTDFAFLHPGPSLRLGAVLTNSVGQRLEFWRRKGRKQTLRGVDDSILADDSLAAFVGLTNRKIFERAFGLSHERLRLGGEAMLKSGGEMGESLVEAGSGLSDLLEIRRELQEKADALFGPRKVATKAIFAGIDAYYAARKRQQEASLNPEQWEQATITIQRVDSELQAATRRQAALEAEMIVLERCKRVVPILRELDNLEVQLSNLGDRVALPEDAALRRQRLLDRLQVAAREMESEQARMVMVDQWLTDHPEPRQWLDRATEIETLDSQLGEILKNHDDLPIRRRELLNAESQLEDLAGRLGLGDPGRLRTDSPDDLKLMRMDRLLREGRLLESTRIQLGENRARLETALDDLRRRQDKIGGVSDPSAQHRQLERLRTRLEGADDSAALCRRIVELDDMLTDRLDRLPYWSGSLEALLALKVPPRSHIMDMDGRFRAMVQDRRQLDEAMRSARRDHDDARLLGQRLAAGQPVPTQEELAAARQRRQEIWRRIKSAPTMDISLQETFEQAIREADDLADRRQWEANRVAQFEQAKGAEAKAETALQRLDHQHLDLDRQHQALEAQWTDLWLATGIRQPGPPPAMLDWLEQVAELRNLSVKRRDQSGQFEGIQHQMTSLANDLSVMETALRQAPGQGSISERLDRLSMLLTDQLHAWEDWRELSARLAELRRELDHCLAEITELESRRGPWMGEWSALMEVLGHDAGLSLDEAEAALGLWREARRVLDRIIGLEGRIHGMQDRCDEFDVAVANLRAQFDSVSETSTIADLSRRLEQARHLATQRRDRLEQRQVLAHSLEELDKSLALARAELAELHAAADATDDETLQRAIGEDAQRRSVLDRVDDARRRLLVAGEGKEEESLRAEIGALDLETVQARALAIEEDLRQAAEQRENLRNQLEEARLQMVGLEQDEHADQAAQEMQNALAGLSRDGREWARLRAASLVLKVAIDRYRDQYQSPLITGASRAFRAFTRESFAQLAVEYDDDNSPRLVGQRLSGDNVPITAMSDGTRDQLYLALRLAALEIYCEREEPLPFVGDDLFLNFDDVRAQAGLRWLAGMDHSQVILFTHHRHFVHLAESSLGRDCHVIALPA